MGDSPLLFVSPAAPAPEERAAWKWLRGTGCPARRISPGSLSAALPEARLVWCHAGGAGPALSSGQAAQLLGWLEQGGRLWLTLQAAELASVLGLERRPPDELGVTPWQHSPTELEALEGERRGLARFGPHPVFEGLQGGALLLQPRAGAKYPVAAYRGPVRGRVVAVEWQYLTIDASQRLAIEYAPGRGRVLSVGAHLLFGEPANPYRPFLERFARNCLAYLAAPSRASSRCFWPAVHIPPPEPFGGSARPPQPDDDLPFGAIGRRIAIIGRQRGGVMEIWSPPVRLARHIRASFEQDCPPDGVRILPSAVERAFSMPDARVLQTVSASANEARLEYTVTSGTLDRLQVEFDVDLRWAWPYPEGVLGQPRLRQQSAQLLLLDQQGRRRGSVRFEPQCDQLDVSDRAGELHVRATFARPRRVVVVFRGTTAARAEGQQEPLLRVETPDTGFDEELAWALHGLRAFDMESPAGRGLVAGFAETGSGWWSGRLGYAWYFGRDSMWSALGCLGAGLRKPVRESLRLLASHQRLDGKILHELSPAGIAHFDAADASPLFLLGLERYVRWTGDLALLRELWPAAGRTLRFCLSTDSDGDGLIENSGVGHGWPEGGPVHGAHATLYLNACWAAALESTAYLAGLLGQQSLVRSCRRRATAVRAQLNGRMYRPSDGWFAYGIDQAGDVLPASTMEPAVAALFGLLDPDLTDRFFEGLASPRFTTPWGVRYIPRDHPAYNPRGYHHGAAWPLFTGWAAAAEYAYGRPEAALAHVRSSLALVRKRSFGVIDEVLNGDEEKPEGVCFHQLWSHAMTVMPIVHGLLGIQPDAVAGKLTLRPQLPPEWDYVRVRDLRVGPRSVSFTYRRAPGGLALDVDERKGLSIDFR
ncbi:MAG TPA: GH116 family glycosyl hydrolase [Chloroflexota bacterium]